MPERQHWEHFSHQADIGVRGTGPGVCEAFEQAACALTAVISDPHKVRPSQRIEIACEAPDLELLLVEWLNELVYEMAVRHMLFSEFHVQIENKRLSGSALGEALDVQRHQPAVEVKGATCTELKVAQDADGNWLAQCVVDV
jgi:SHS2 domain-containing protein